MPLAVPTWRRFSNLQQRLGRGPAAEAPPSPSVFTLYMHRQNRRGCGAQSHHYPHNLCTTHNNLYTLLTLAPLLSAPPSAPLRWCSFCFAVNLFVIIFLSHCFYSQFASNWWESYAFTRPHGCLLRQPTNGPAVFKLPSFPLSAMSSEQEDLVNNQT